MDLTTTYMGLELRSPLVPSASAPLTHEIENVKKMEDAGAGAVVLHSLFEEQLKMEQDKDRQHHTYGIESSAEALRYLPEPRIFQVDPSTYLNNIRAAKEMVKIPIIASLNGSTMGGWTEYAVQIEEAGADAIELNIYQVPTDFDRTGSEIEQTYLDIVSAVKSAVSIPVAVKLSPYFSNMANMAKQISEVGADGLVLFNRFYQPDIYIDSLEVRPSILLSTPQALRLPMRWIAILYGRVSADLAASGGISIGQEAIKMLMAGASITMVCSALLRHGINYLSTIEEGMCKWMQDNDYTSVRQLQGIVSQENCPDPDAFERAQYIRAIQSYLPSKDYSPSRYYG
ncbi:MAG: dihydroorotate dehydrogenase-like protein [Synechococcus sp.]